MARHLLRPVAGVALLLAALAAAGCHHDSKPEPAGSSSAAAASASSYAANARDQHFEKELARARERWKSKPSLGDCNTALKEKSDLALCTAAQSALDALAADSEAPAERTVPSLATAALALARFSERIRFLSLSELAQKRLLRDGGAPASSAQAVRPLGSAQAAARPAQTSKWPNGKLHDLKRPLDRETFELGDGPIAKMMGETVHAERDVVRALGAYLEYAELPVRRAAFAAVKNLHDERPQWPLLSHLLREAMLLESDPELKHDLQAVLASELPRGAGPGHSPDSK